MASDDLCYTTATEALAKFRSGELSPVELMSAVIARSEAVNPAVNAYTYTFYERALEQAKQAEALYASGAETRPLEGVPIVIKDFHPVEGEITTFGSRMFADHVPDRSVPTVARLLGGGRDHACADDHAGDGPRAALPQRSVGQHAQPVEPGLRPRWLVGRCRGGGGGRHARRSRTAPTAAARSACRRRAAGISATSRRSAATRSTGRILGNRCCTTGP